MPLVASAEGECTDRQLGVFALLCDVLPRVQPGIWLHKGAVANRHAENIVRAYRRCAPQNELLHAHHVELGNHANRDAGPGRHSPGMLVGGWAKTTCRSAAASSSEDQGCIVTLVALPASSCS